MRRQRNPAPDEIPGGSGSPKGPHPIDLAHLERQTLGDNNLQREILAMFVSQIASVRDAIAMSRGDDRRRIAHGVVGSARGVGAFALAACAAAIEEDPASAHLVEHFQALTDEVCTFIAGRHGQIGAPANRS